MAHDLRAPLRSIRGFSQALLEDYDGVVDERGKRYLHHVAEAADDMGELIDALIRLSQVADGEMLRAEIDLGELARSVALAIAASDPDRQVEWEIQENVRAYGDERLLQIAFENLHGMPGSSRRIALSPGFASGDETWAE